jgi:synaptobrevin homolog YKT6
MVKLSCVVILKYNGPDKDPYILGLEADLSSFGYFQRGTVKEMMTFVSRTVARKTQVGQRQTVQQEEYFCHAFNKDGLVGIAFVDQDYPARAGFCVVNKILEDFQLQQGEAWRGVTVDNPELAQTLLTDALVKFQVGFNKYRFDIRLLRRIHIFPTITAF